MSKATHTSVDPLRVNGELHDRVRVAEELASLQAAFPWSGELPMEERMRFARELADHPKRATDRDLDRLLAGWKARARAHVAQGRRTLRRAA